MRGRQDVSGLEPNLMMGIRRSASLPAKEGQGADLSVGTPSLADGQVPRIANAWYVDRLKETEVSGSVWPFLELVDGRECNEAEGECVPGCGTPDEDMSSDYSASTVTQVDEVDKVRSEGCLDIAFYIP